MAQITEQLLNSMTLVISGAMRTGDINYIEHCALVKQWLTQIVEENKDSNKESQANKETIEKEEVK